LTLQDDSSILASGLNPDQDAYIIEADVQGKIGAIRLEVIPDPSMPNRGSGRAPTGVTPGGNFELTDFRVLVDQHAIAWSRAFADFRQEYQITQNKYYKKDFPIDLAIDDDESTGWAIYPQLLDRHWAVFVPSQPIAAAEKARLTIRLAFHSKENKQHNLGRFRLSVGDGPTLEGEEKRIAKISAIRKIYDGWARLAAAYYVIGDQQALDTLIKRHPKAAIALGDMHAAAKDWERAIAEYRKAITNEPGDVALTSKLLSAYQSVGRTREAVAYLAQASAANPKDTILSQRVAGLQAWFGQEKELAATRQRILAFAKGTDNWNTADRAAKTCSLQPSTEKAELEAALALGRRAVELQRNDWTLLALGMAEYRIGNDAAAVEALLAAEESGAKNAIVMGTAPFYRAMSQFRQGKPDEARKVVFGAAAKMQSLPKDGQNPLVNVGNSDYLTSDYLTVWLAYKEACALLKIDPALNEILTTYASAGRTREAVPYLAELYAATPEDTMLSLKVAALQAWFGQEKELAGTRQRILAFAKSMQDDPAASRRLAKACSIHPHNDKAELEAALALARNAVKLQKNIYGLQIVGMAEYRAGTDAAAVEALLAAEKSTGQDLDKAIAAFYRAMSLFRQGKADEARKVATQTAAKMKPLPKDEENPLASGANHDDLILWLAYKEVCALLKIDPALNESKE
jgi:tetratricopeptide (TPR) repeat protein